MNKISLLALVSTLLAMTQAVMAAEGDADFLEKAGVSTLAEGDKQLDQLKQEFIAASQSLLERMPNYGKALVHARLENEAISFQKQSAQHVTTGFRLRDTKRRLYNLIGNLLRCSNTKFPGEPEWRATREKYDQLILDFDKRVDAATIEKHAADTLKSNIRSTLKRIGGDVLAETYWISVNEQIESGIQDHANKLVLAVSTYFAQQGRDTADEKDQEFVMEAYDNFATDITSLLQAQLPQDISEPAELMSARSRLEEIRQDFSEGFDVAAHREFAAKSAAIKERLQSESSPEAVLAEEERLHQEHMKRHGPFPPPPAPAEKKSSPPRPKRVMTFESDQVQVNEDRSFRGWLVAINLIVVGAIAWFLIRRGKSRR